MTQELSVEADWEELVIRLGGAERLEESGRSTGAFLRPREIRSAVDMLRLVLGYCLGDRGLRLTAGWAAAAGLADISNVALLYRLRQCGAWLEHLVGEALGSRLPKTGGGRLIRIIDATTVSKAERDARRRNGVWRVHAAFDLPVERFGAFELTDEKGGERLDRIAVTPGEIRIGDRAHLQPERIARVLDQGGDVLIRASWRNARWCDAEGEPVDLAGMLATSGQELIDQPIWIARKKGQPLALRLVALRRSEQAAAEARRKARRQAQKEGYTLSPKGLAAADWLILITSLKPEDTPADDLLALYRLRWRIELAFKRLKSIVGLKQPPGTDPRSARAWILAHLLMILLLEPLLDGLEDSPHWQLAA